ncbi:LytR C-terminal domain-containing protein [Alloscardovia venturai]|uniref:LytR C-terminal domain-containing protein n=1 Tax=Alloscardovia venturai TaxID=1769421 RepID=A0ABW2Y445_9BIFI
MADNSVRNEREQRKLYLRARQRMILTGTVGFLVVAVLISLVGAFGVFSPAKAKSDLTVQNNFGVQTACLAQGTTMANPAEITLRVLNGTSKSGLATAVSEELHNRGFIIQGVGDYDSTQVLARTEIRFGKNAVAQAYSVASYFNDAILRMDSRDDNLIDVVIGSSFNDLIDTKLIPKTGAKLESRTNCVDVSKLQGVPQAPQHQAA